MRELYPFFLDKYLIDGKSIQQTGCIEVWIDPAAHHTLPTRIVLTYFQRSREEQRGRHVRPADTTWCDLEETYVARGLVAF